MSVSEVIVAGGLAGVIVLTIIANLPTRLGGRLRTADTLGMLVQSTYFAPHPGRFDYVLLSRFERADGSLTIWREYPSTPSGRWPRWLLNPSRRHNKAMTDLCRNLGEFYEASGEEALRISLPYVLLLEVVAGLAGPDDATGVQFAVLAMAGPDDSESAAVLSSDMHPLR